MFQQLLTECNTNDFITQYSHVPPRLSRIRHNRMMWRKHLGNLAQLQVDICQLLSCWSLMQMTSDGLNFVALPKRVNDFALKL